MTGVAILKLQGITRSQTNFSVLSKSMAAGSIRLERVAAHVQPGVRSFAAMGDGFEKVQIGREGDEKSVFDAYVIGKEGLPGVVMVQEWWGVDFEIKNHATAISLKGYRALIPDLYRGKVGLVASEAQHLMENLDWEGAVKDIDASVKWLKGHASSKVGVTGFCMGGALSLASSVRVSDIDAVVAFYGTPPPALADTTMAKVPVQAHFGELDSHKGFSDVGAAKSLEENLKVAKVPFEVHMYSNNGHAFMNTSEEALERNKANNFPQNDPKAAELAWSRFHAWFAKYLKN